jgi:hypothetical protein
MTGSLAEARKAKEIVKHLLIDVEGVSGIGVTWDDQGTPAVLVNVRSEAIPAVNVHLSMQHFDVPIVLQAIGTITLEAK